MSSRNDPPLLYLDQTEIRRAKKKFFGDCPSPHPPPPSLSQGLDPVLVLGGLLFVPACFFRYKGVGYTRAESHCTQFLTLSSFLREAVARNGI